MAGKELRHRTIEQAQQAFGALGSCGTAAYHDKTVSVFDIANDRLWANFKDLALQYGLRARWSTPIHGSDGRVLGTFANYYRVVRDPSPADRELTELITHTAAMAIEQDRQNRVSRGVGKRLIVPLLE